MRRWLAMVAVVALAGAARGWDCVCNPRECEALEPSGCPGMGIVVWDPCRLCRVAKTEHRFLHRSLRDSELVNNAYSIGLRLSAVDPHWCCKVCARTMGEDCGGFRGTCEPGLKCYEGSCTPIT